MSLLETPLQSILIRFIHRGFVKAGFPRGVSRNALLHVIRCVRAFDFEQHVQNARTCRVPCLRIHAKDDPLINIDRFHELDEVLQSGDNHIFEKAGHNPQKTQSRALSNVIQLWAQKQGWGHV